MRSGGHQFHEGLDLKPVSRDRHGEPLDSIFAAFPGVVRHINSSPGDSAYGRYIVLEHPDFSPGIYTLYAHLSKIDPGIRVGGQVEAGQVIAVMGHSSGGYSIPRDRAHMHFEMGVMVSRDFQTWYDAKKFGSRNDQGIWNGMNLMGFDPLDFLTKYRANEVNDFGEYFKQMKTAVRVRIATRKMPDFVQRYPSLLKAPMPLSSISGWEIDFNWTGLPFAWRPLTGADAPLLAAKPISIVYVDEAEVSRHHSKMTVRTIRGNKTMGKDLEAVIQQLFGMR
ncbi:MAG TPA: M23 family metallopeptidase [Opitutaceae bacterium]|nr:M23 family metallopeptidase [Opitutaceae bacterium]